ncbi:hypothetical protein STEG23_011075, partial [Scotinomys teguina]
MLCRLLYHLDHMLQETHWYLLVPDMSEADKDATRSLWQAPTDDSQQRALGFWTNSLPSSADNYSPFDKQLLAYYWALVETEHWTMGYQ